ncbi:uncharacterized protein LOC123551669 [Mercenaria mercenaria]|uniref:uncharacterized protein LOC123551669 n=1 Tax=Mercenaria mercenaria TaxID=6596 RepID=UPI00234EC146|nr:uncharacterized protein LOC123551669 [Mercenaria mercenaria]
MKTPTYRIDGYPDDPMEIPDYDGFSRLSPQGIYPGFEDPYRCPVSTPTVNRRQNFKSPNHQPPFMTFTSMNRSLQIPNNISVPKYKSKYTKSSRPTAKAQNKNFDCYFVRNIDKTVHIDAQTQSTWLSTLCAQPVDEIFTKYKRKSEGVKISQQVSRSGNSTPGEKALLSAWSSNASNRRSYSGMSKSTKSVHTKTTARSSRTSFVDPNLRIQGFDSDHDRMSTNVGFALLPASPTSYDGDDTTVSSRASPLFHKVFRNHVNQNSADHVGHVNTNVYAQYQRDKRFPEIRPRKSALSPTRKRIVSDSKETHSMSMTYPTNPYDLEESPMHIVQLGHGLHEKPTSAKATVQNECPYRLPKALSMSLPELQGTG